MNKLKRKLLTKLFTEWLDKETDVELLDLTKLIDKRRVQVAGPTKSWDLDNTVMEWNEYFRGIAHQVKLKSKDARTQIGAVIVGHDNEIVSTGYNSFPRGIDDDVIDRQTH